MDESGLDNEGKAYTSCKEMWQAELGEKGEKRETWYSKAVEYWEKSEPTYNGVMGGFEKVSPLDVRDSKKFLKRHLKHLLEQKEHDGRKLRVLDCGAGVGRVSQELLLEFFDTVDLVEPVGKLLDTAKVNLAQAVESGRYPDGHAAGEFFVKGLQELELEPESYDVIWLQWAMLYLTDDDAKAFFEKSLAALRPRGRIFVKENTCEVGFVVDKDDSSLTRSRPYMEQLFKQAGAVQLGSARQTGFPEQLFEVQMYCLARPGNI
ncbi:unnamed protein product [Pedinophyceae sp. YPF-701]|nr:unnamed protein product [Pedinophyceae sp. YPF-701]